MGAVEDIRELFQDFIAPELRELRAEVKSLDQKYDMTTKMLNEKIDALAQRMERQIEHNHREVMVNLTALQNYSLLSQ